MSPKAKNRSENQSINLRELEQGQTILDSYPPVLFVELTQNCNLHCKMCRAGAGYSTDLDMADAIFQKLRDELFPFAEIVDLRGWGESTILRTIGSRIDETAASGVKIRLVTNGLAVNRARWKQLMTTGAAVAVSVDSANESSTRSLERGNFGRLMHSLEAGAEERDRAGDVAGSITFNTVLSSENIDEIEQILQLAARLKVPRLTAFPVVARRSNPLHLDNRHQEIPSAIRQAGEAARALGVEFRLGASPHEAVTVFDALPERCSHPWEYCYIDYAGNVGYCDHLIGNKKLMLGNLGDSSFDAIWNGPDFQRLRRLHLTATRDAPGDLDNTLPHCAWCYKRRYVDFEDTTNPIASSRVVSTSNFLPLISNAPEPHFKGDFM